MKGHRVEEKVASEKILSVDNTPILLGGVPQPLGGPESQCSE